MPLPYRHFIFSRKFQGLLLILSLFLVANLHAQDPKYRTFSQSSLSDKKAKAGKLTGSSVCFTFHNTTDSVNNDLHAKFNTHIISVDNAGGFPTATIVDKGKSLDLSGMDVAPGDSVTICLTVDKKDADSHANFWWWTKNSVQIGPKNGALANSGYTPIQIQPNGGNALEYIYKKIITRPNGLVVGIPQPTKDSALVHGWIRYMKADRKYFPHVGNPRCFDLIVNGNGGTKPFVKQLKNPHVKKHDNELLGELHALKLACVANDSGFTEPLDTNAALFCSLVYNDTVNPGDPCNGKSIEELIYLADSALTYCGYTGSPNYADLDSCIKRINRAFDGPYVAVSFSPLIIAGTHTLAEVYFLHAPPPGNTPIIRPRLSAGASDLTPGRYELLQNYPNPFNPTTIIEFNLPEAARVTLNVYNLIGQQVASVLDNREFDDGEQSVEFDASSLPSGIYFYRISAVRTEDGRPVYNAMKKMILIK
jgi:type IX secretion system substrate protein